MCTKLKHVKRDRDALLSVSVNLSTTTKVLKRHDC